MARRSNMAANARARYEANRARKDAALQAARDEKNEREKMIMQANMSAQAYADQMYWQQKNAKKAAKTRMIDDRELRRRGRLDGIKSRNAQEHAARQQQYRTQELNQDQAGMQAERDQQLHGYGQQDASQANDFNRGMANLNNSNMMGRDARLHGYGQQDSAQAQQYGVQNATTAYDRAVDGANLQNRFNQEAAERQQLYGRENAQMSHQIGMARDQNSYQLDQFGANAQQGRGQQDAIAQQGRGRSDMMFANNVERGNALEERNTRLIDEGWTFTRGQQAKLDGYEKEEDIVGVELTDYKISQTEAESQMDTIRTKRRGVTPPQKPVKRDTGKIHAEQTWTDKNTGVTYNVIEGKPSSVAYDPRQGGRSSGGGDQGSFDPAGNLTFETDNKIRGEVNKAYGEYKKNEMMMATDGTVPKVKSQVEWLREQLPFMNPHVQRIYQGVLQSLASPSPKTPGNNPAWFQNMTSGQPPTAQQPEQNWQDAGTALLNNGQFMAGPKSKAGEWAEQSTNVLQDPTIARAIQGFPERAKPLADQLGGAMRRFEQIVKQNKDPNEVEPALLDHIAKLRDELRLLGGSGVKPDFMQQFADPGGNF